MREIVTDTIINAPARVVWEVLTHFASYPEWNPYITHVEGVAREGEVLKVQMHLPGGKPRTVTPEVFLVRETQGLAWDGVWVSGLMLRAVHSFEIRQVNPSSVQLVQREEFSGLMVPFMGGMIEKTRRGFAMMNKALKERAQKVAGLMV